MKIGAAFSEHIKTERLSRRYSEDNKKNPLRHFILLILLIFSTGILFLKLTNVQLINGQYYRTLSDSNRTRTYILMPSRGIIFDRNGRPLVYNMPGFEKTVGEEEVQVDREKALELLSKNQDIQIEPLRNYPLKAATAHILGYIGPISKEELIQPENNDALPTDIIGKSGIEHYYDRLLSGVKGKTLVEVDAAGKKIRTLGQTDPIPGQNITLTLDFKLQQAVYDAFPSDKKGVIIVSSPQGEILAMVSKPSFDTNLFTMGKSYSATNSAYQNVEDILSDSDNHPLLNRAISGEYPPGSTFKIITAAAGLENKIIDASYQVEDTGILKVGDFSFANWFYTDYGGKDGNVNVVKALMRSNDIFFYKLAEKIGVDSLSSIAVKFGLGKQLGIDLPGEAEGLVPTKKWKEQVIREPWYLGDTYHYGIGQGYLLTTPLQVNSWTGVVANGGSFYKPRLIKNTTNTTNNPINIISKDTTDLIRQGMIESCSPGGVAFPLFKLKIKNENLKIDRRNFMDVREGTESAMFKDYREVSIACKTGTAQHGGEDTEPHAWITLFAPAYNPQIVVTVLIESGGQGSSEAAPIAKKVLEYYFGRN